jgi:hypothetical protein
MKGGAVCTVAFPRWRWLAIDHGKCVVAISLDASENEWFECEELTELWIIESGTRRPVYRGIRDMNQLPADVRHGHLEGSHAIFEGNDISIWGICGTET